MSWARRRRVLVVGLAFGLLVVSAAGLARLRFDTDVLSLLPRQGRAIPAFREFLRHFGGFDHLYVVFTAPAGHRIGEYESEIHAWVDALRDVPEIDRVDSGVPDETRDWAWLAERQLLLLRNARLDAAIARLRPGGMHDALIESRALLAVPSREVADLVRQDPLGLLALVRGELGQAQAGVNLGGGPDGYSTPDGTRRLVIARPTRPPYDTAFSNALFARLEQLRTSLAHDGRQEEEGLDEPLPPMKVEFAGGHRIAIETEQIVRRESVTNTAGSLALILPLLFLVFRSAWLVAVGAIPSALSLALVLGALGFSGATLSAAATGAAAMMFGLGVDGVVLLYATHRLAQSSGASDAEVDRRVGAASASMLLGMWTTAATFYGLMLVDFPSLTQLGMLVGHSMAVCGILTLLLVPALLPRRARPAPLHSRHAAPGAGSRQPRHDAAPARPARAVVMPRLASFVLRHRRALLVGTAAVTVVLAVLATRVRVNPTLERLRSVSEGAQFEIEMARAFGLPDESYVVLARGGDLEALLRRNERLVQQLRQRVTGLSLQAPSMLLPSSARQSAVRARIARELPPAAEIVEALRRQGEEAGFNAGTFAPFEQRLAQMTSPGIALSAEAFAAHGLGDLLQRFVVR
ncbi:MAG TPA: MMPL family transporter, partial [Woeseiaceae bacterium]|nr:MMPL family transporter [Woeseiaceae bacterium]